jgi:hypothetical protein
LERRRTLGPQTLDKTVTVMAVASILVLYAIVRMVGLGPPAGPAEPEIPAAVSEERIDFGRIPLHGSVIREFILKNTGEGLLHAQLSVSGTDFSVSPMEVLLPPGMESRVSVAVTADRPGPFDDELHIRFVGEELEPLRIRLAGEADSAEEIPEAELQMQRA